MRLFGGGSVVDLSKGLADGVGVGGHDVEAIADNCHQNDGAKDMGEGLANGGA